MEKIATHVPFNEQVDKTITVFLFTLLTSKSESNISFSRKVGKQTAQEPLHGFLAVGGKRIKNLTKGERGIEPIPGLKGRRNGTVRERY